MPNIDSAKKRVVQSEKRRQNNMARKSSIKTAIKKVIDALNTNAVDQAKELLRAVEAQLSRAASKGVVHKNAASRKVSRLANRVKKQELAPAGNK
jgi:small subunit ribosomal protein S20